VREAEEFEQKLAAAVVAGEADDVPVPWADRISSPRTVPQKADGETVAGAKVNGRTSETRDPSPPAEGEDRGANGDSRRDGKDERDGGHASRAAGAAPKDVVDGSRPSDSSEEAKDVGESDADAAGVAADGKDQSAPDDGHDDAQHGEMMVEEEDTVLF
jgi:hypothetical protein